MEYVAPILMGLGLACCAGLRAWLPLLIMSGCAYTGYVELSPTFSFLASPHVLLLLVVATLIETIGDKFPAVDHFLDAAGTLLRPVAGTVLSSSMLTGMDPGLSIVLGLAVGGTAAFAVNGGKALARTWVTAMIPAHGGIGNAVLSTIEDGTSLIGVLLAGIAPWLAAFVAVLLLGTSLWMLYMFFRQGGRIFSWLFGRMSGKDVIDVTLNAQKRALNS